MTPAPRPRLAGSILGLLGILLIAFGCRQTSPVVEPDLDSSLDASAPGDPSSLTAEERAVNLSSFDHIWSTVSEKHWESNPGGTDWNAVRDRYRPRLEQATTQQEARRVLSEVLSELGQSHFGIVPREVYARVDDPEAVGEGRLGLTIRIIDEKPVVIRSQDASLEAGIQTGWILESVDERSIAEELLKISKTATEDAALRAQLQTRRIEQLLSGEPGTKLSVTLRDLEGLAHSFSVELRTPPGKPVRMGMLPEIRVDVEARELGDYGYFRLSAFLDPMRVMSTYRTAIRDFADKQGLIIDLRGNPGGLGYMASGLAGHLIAEGTPDLGVMTMRESEIHFVVNPQIDLFTGPVAVLVDENSASTSEIFAAGLQDLGRARIFGQRTAGAALPSVFERLPNGDGFQYAIANYVRSTGEAIEGEGVTPDVAVTYERASLAKGEDPFIAAAIAWFEQLEDNERSPK